MRNIIAIIIFLCLTSCSDNQEYSATPAQSQINDYTAALKKCKEAAKPQLSSAVVQEPEAQQETTEAPAPPQEEQKIISTARNFEPADDDMILGTLTNAKVVFVEYFSPTCPHCAYYKKEILPKIKEKYIDTDKIVYVIREFIGNKQDLDAAILARCSSNKETFFKFVDVILAQQDNWAVNKNYREILTNIGQLGGVSAQSYAECLNNDKLANILIANTKLAATAPKFIGTPAFFINGVQFTEPYTVDAISRAIEQALNTSDGNNK